MPPSRVGPSRRGCAPLRKTSGGFTYLGLLALIVIMGLMAAMAGEVASTRAQREREAELLFIGHQFRDAIERYYRQNHRFPMALTDLSQDSADELRPQHFIRRLYADPMTHATDWTLVPAATGGYMGVASTSERAPLKRARFDPVDTDFDLAEKYSDWTFVYDPLLKFRGAVPAPKSN